MEERRHDAHSHASGSPSEGGSLLSFKSLRGTIIAAGIVTLALCLRHFGFIVILEAFVLLLWMPFGLWAGFRNPEKRSLRAAKTGIWLLSIGIVVGVHFGLASRTRANAQKIVDAIQSYRTAHGAYPEDIRAIGYSNAKLRSDLGLSGYYLKDDEPRFFYASTYVVFQTEDYDFSTREWRHVGD